MEPLARDGIAGFRMPVMDKFKDMGCVVMGKSEQGCVAVGDSLLLMPVGTVVKVTSIFRDDDEVALAGPGENLRVRGT